MVKNRNYQISKRWRLAEPVKTFESAIFSTDFVRLLASRGITSEEQAKRFVFPDYTELLEPNDLPDMQKAVRVILAALENNEKIAIYGDYDVDGVTATAILCSYFHKIGIDVVSYIPSRFEEGYGLNKEAIKSLAKTGIKLLITVDCGSTSVNEIKFATKLGLSVVITDHHTIDSKFSDSQSLSAAAFVNPKRLTKDNPLYDLAGVGVAFYLIRALQSQIKDGLPEGQEKWFLDLVALGTICDVVPMIGQNRLLAKYGLKVISTGRRLGLRVLADIAKVNLDFVDSYKIGFYLGPRLNAAGRIEHAKMALDLLLTDDLAVATKIATKLEQLNMERQELTERIVEEARQIVGKSNIKQKIFLLSGRDWPSGVVGIVASRLAEEYRKPMLVMEDLGEELKGSARSIENFNIIDALSDCGELLTRYGGHAFAAGFSLKKDKFILLSEKLIKITNNKISEEDMIPVIQIDMEIMNKNIVQNLFRIYPYSNLLLIKIKNHFSF
jgi:single-stranded-DNA-specific exonuclease